ncbi:hypothetical protein BGZ68_004631 [Mortierella alpina]|nr:hypothetical protein BGZ68_004631 [Mortierella alpina]
MIRATADHQEHIVEDISDIRRLIDTFFHYLPKLPQMRIVHLSLPIPKGGRRFPAVLGPLEHIETGHRTLPGQWISDSKVWDKIMGMPVANTVRNHKDPYAAREGEKVIFYTHGGGYFICSNATHREMLWRISRATGRRIFGKDRATGSDASHAFCHLTDSNGCGFEPENVTAAGDSAGGGLMLALMMYQRDNGLPTPSKAILLSPWLDLTMSCDSWVTNSMDYLPCPPKSDHKFNPISFYCSGRDKIKTLVRHPYISPLWGNLQDLPPLQIQCGEAERLRDECILYTYKAGGHLGPINRLPFQKMEDSTAGLTQTGTSFEKSGPVELDIYPGMVHVFQAIPFLPESSMALERMRDFMERKEAETMEETEKMVRINTSLKVGEGEIDTVLVTVERGAPVAATFKTERLAGHSGLGESLGHVKEWDQPRESLTATA